MKKYLGKSFAVLAAMLLLSVTVMELSAEARAGGGRSFGSRGSRSYSRPATSYSQPYQSRQQMAPAPSPFQQSAGGGFMRSMAGGIMGGLLGGMLFRSLGFAGPGGMGGGGIGLFEIILIGGLCYLIYRFIKKKREESAPVTMNSGYQRGTVTPLPTAFEQVTAPMNEVATGLGHVRQMDSSFDEAGFSDLVMDIFFRIQGAWMNRSLDPVAGLLTDEMRQVMQEDISRLLRDNQVNRLENIAVRKVEIVEAWQEAGQDFITTLIYANLLDYTTDDKTGAVVAGSRTEPVKFEEYWTFTRPVGNNQWRLSALSQK